MLQKKRVTPGTLELLKSLMRINNSMRFFLAGGTALSLQIGHRISIDIDLFSEKPFRENDLTDYLEKNKQLKLNYIDKNTIKGQIDNIQLDLITRGYPLIKEIITEETIRLASLEDIAAMKLNAVIGNGTRLKDFVDIAFLSAHLSLRQMINAYEHKYQSRKPLMIIKSLAYHDEINFNEPMLYIDGTYSWALIENRLNQMIKSPAKLFPVL